MLYSRLTAQDMVVVKMACYIGITFSWCSKTVQMLSARMYSPQVERRPPLYNAEDYVSGLKRFCKLTGLQMYLADATSTDNSPDGGNTNDSKKSAGKNRKEHGGGDGSGGGGGGGPDEMGLRQFSSVSELLSKLKSDLNTSLASFRREFVCAEENDGVTLLLDLLKAIQLAQTNITGSLNQLGSRANHVMFKRALADEFEALLCLRACARAPENGAGGAEDGAARLAAHPSGLFTVAVCVMSNYSKSRVLSLQLLARLCEMEGGHKQVSHTLHALRKSHLFVGSVATEHTSLEAEEKLRKLPIPNVCSFLQLDESNTLLMR